LNARPQLAQERKSLRVEIERDQRITGDIDACAIASKVARTKSRPASDFNMTRRFIIGRSEQEEWNFHGTPEAPAE